MSRPITPIFFSGRTIQAPQGEAAYWAHLIATRGNVVTMTANETLNLPYLGYVRCPEDRLAIEWLIDQHVQETTK